MTKRFGRNQKRKLKEQLEYLQRIIDTQKLVIEQKNQEIITNQFHFDIIREVVGECSVLLPPKLRYMHDNTTCYTVYSSGEQFVVSNLPIIKTKSFVDSVEGLVHFKVLTPNGTLGYTTNMERIDKSWKKKIVGYNIAEQIVNEMELR